MKSDCFGTARQLYYGIGLESAGESCCRIDSNRRRRNWKPRTAQAKRTALSRIRLWRATYERSTEGEKPKG